MGKFNVVFFRNDDVGHLSDKGLKEVTDIFLNERIPIIHAVVPATISKEAANWLKEIKANNPDLIEIIQHGWRHPEPPNEFGGNRSYKEQYRGILAGKNKLTKIFRGFYPAFSFPGGFYNKYSIQVLSDLGFKVLSSHCSYKFWRRSFYKFGHFLHKGRLLNRHISYHERFYPKTDLIELSVCVNLVDIKDLSIGYIKSVREILKEFERCRKYYRIVGFLLHHRYFDSTEKLLVLKNILVEVKNIPSIKFGTLIQFRKRNVKR